MEMEYAAPAQRKRNYFKQHIRPLIVKGIMRLSSSMPLALSHAAGALIGKLAYHIENDVRHAAAVNIRLCLPELNTEQQSHLLKRYLIETGKTAMESGAMWLRSSRAILKQVRQVSGEQLVEEAMASGRGTIFAIPHLGEWEMVGLYCSSRYPMTSLYRPLKIPALDAVVRRGRERLGATLVPTDHRGVKGLLRALKRGETVGILPDQEPGRGQGEFAPFFGTPAYSMTLLSRLVQKTGATVIFTYAERLPKGRGFHLHFRRAPEGIDSAELSTSLGAVNRGIETCIEACPEQYQWGYRRFRTRPDGEASYY